MAFSYRLECLGKADKGREERDHSGQELHELGEIGLGITSHRMEGVARHMELPPTVSILSKRS